MLTRSGAMVLGYNRTEQLCPPLDKSKMKSSLALDPLDDPRPGTSRPYVFISGTRASTSLHISTISSRFRNSHPHGIKTLRVAGSSPRISFCQLVSTWFPMSLLTAADALQAACFIEWDWNRRRGLIDGR